MINDPNPVRFDGIPPELEQVLLASLFDISGILTQAIVANTGGGDAVYYFINDHLGTPKKVMDESGQVVWEADYKPFGEATVTSEVFGNNFRFPGQYYDQETGLHYNYHRYYDPQIGRYLRADPIGLAGGINLFGYAQNNPINLIDPLGLIVGADPFDPVPSLPDKDWGKIIGGGAIVAFSVVEAGVGGALIGVGIVEIAGGGAAGPAGLAVAIPVGIHTIGLGGVIWGNAALTGNIGAKFFMEGWNDGKEDPCNGK